MAFKHFDKNAMEFQVPPQNFRSQRGRRIYSEYTGLIAKPI